MIKNAVQNNADAVRRGIADERVEIFQSTQKRVDFFEIARIVAVIGKRPGISD